MDKLLLWLSKNGVSWERFWRLYRTGALKDVRVPDEFDPSSEFKGISFVTVFSEKYPEKLKKLDSPPFVLFYRGDLELCRKETIGIVGSRRATVRGKEFAKSLSSGLAERGFVIVSGLAAGIDAAAHEGALSVFGKTIAVLGTGVDVVYPKINWRLYEKIAEKGLLLSPFWPGTPARKFNFPIRNRILAALSDRLIVVEASEKSGALITARCAMSLKIPVYAVPGRPADDLSRGTNKLIKEGAILLDDISDLIPEAAKKKRPEGDERILELIENGVNTAEAIAAHLEKSIPEVQIKLLELELMGLVRKSVGGVYEKA